MVVMACRFPDIPVGKERVPGVPVNCVGHVSVWFPCKQVHQPGKKKKKLHSRGWIFTYTKQLVSFKPAVLFCVVQHECVIFTDHTLSFFFLSFAAYLGLSSFTTDFTKDRKSLQKFIQTVGFQQLCSFCMRNGAREYLVHVHITLSNPAQVVLIETNLNHLGYF